MSRTRARAGLVLASVPLAITLAAGPVHAQTPTSPTTQLQTGPSSSTTVLAGSGAVPNRVDAGGGGTAGSDSTFPLTLVAVATGMVIVTAASARRARSELAGPTATTPRGAGR